MPFKIELKLSAFGEDWSAENDEIKVSINIDSREYNGKWYTNVTAWRIELNQQAESSAPPAGAPAPNEAPPEISDEGDDLPF